MESLTLPGLGPEIADLREQNPANSLLFVRWNQLDCAHFGSVAHAEQHAAAVCVVRLRICPWYACTHTLRTIEPSDEHTGGDGGGDGGEGVLCGAGVPPWPHSGAITLPEELEKSVNSPVQIDPPLISCTCV